MDGNGKNGLSHSPFREKKFFCTFQIFTCPGKMIFSRSRFLPFREELSFPVPGFSRSGKNDLFPFPFFPFPDTLFPFPFPIFRPCLILLFKSYRNCQIFPT